MKTLTIGDLHGHSTWKRINPEDYDILIFLGDYMDSLFVDDDEMVLNLEEVISLKQRYPEKVKLLIGNHEISYLYRPYRASGYRYSIAEKVRNLLERNTELFQLSFQHQQNLWTHAGLHNEYYLQRIMLCIRENDQNLSDTLERLYKHMYEHLFEVGPERGGFGKKAIGGPFWLHSTRLLENPLKGFHQIVGHTPVKSIEHHVPDDHDPDTTVTLCDCIERGDRSFYELEI
jgi:hypothetical protein